MTPELDFEEYRPAFEATVALGLVEAGANLGANALGRDSEGTYQNDEINLMWSGYLIGLTVMNIAHRRAQEGAASEA